MQVGIGEAMAVGSAATWAFGVILARQIGRHVPPPALNLLKNGIFLCVLLPATLMFHRGPWPHFSGNELSLVLASGIIGIAVADTLYYRALNELGAGRMGVIGNLYSPTVLVLGFAFLGERLGLRQWAGVALVAAGVGLVARVGAPHDAARPAHPLRGVLIGMLSIVLMAAAIVMIKRVLESQPLLWVTSIRLGGAVCGLLLLAALPRLRGAFAVQAAAIPWPRLVLAALAGQGLSMVLWLGGYKYTSASVAAILNETASVFLVLMGAFWLGEPLGRRTVCGVVLTFGGIACMLAGDSP